MTAKITLINFGEPGLINATVHYQILAPDDTLLYEETEIVPVETQKEYVKTFDVKDFKDGDYKLRMDLQYPGQSEPAASESVFKVRKNMVGASEYLMWASIILGGVFVVIVAYMKRKEIFKTHKKGKKEFL